MCGKNDIEARFLKKEPGKVVPYFKMQFPSTVATRDMILILVLFY